MAPRTRIETGSPTAPNWIRRLETAPTTAARLPADKAGPTDPRAQCRLVGPTNSVNRPALAAPDRPLDALTPRDLPSPAGNLQVTRSRGAVATFERSIAKLRRITELANGRWSGWTCRMQHAPWLDRVGETPSAFRTNVP
jgi:hypothetical protein